MLGTPRCFAGDSPAADGSNLFAGWLLAGAAACAPLRQGCPRQAAGGLCGEHWEHPLQPVKSRVSLFAAPFSLSLSPALPWHLPPSISLPGGCSVRPRLSPAWGCHLAGWGPGGHPAGTPHVPGAPMGPGTLLPALSLFPGVCGVAAAVSAASPTPRQNIMGGIQHRGSDPGRAFLDTRITIISFFPGFPHPASVLHPPTRSCPLVSPSGPP